LASKIIYAKVPECTEKKNPIQYSVLVLDHMKIKKYLYDENVFKELLKNVIYVEESCTHKAKLESAYFP